MHDRWLILTYLAYGAIAVPLVIWLARTLFEHGATFLEDVFDDQPELARAVNRLLVIGFYMLNLGYALLLLTVNSGVATALAAVELLITKLGILLVTLGVIHFLNMFVFWRIRRRAEDQRRVPVAPAAYHPAPGSSQGVPPPPPSIA